LETVDVAIQVYGKPLQTAVTLLSLLEHSGECIGTIWFIEERKQPFDAKFTALRDFLGYRTRYYRPPFWLGSAQLPWRSLYRLRPIRWSTRYQYAWENSIQRYLYITHNDVLYSADILAPLMNHIEGHLAAGPIGQCWNCPARTAQVCSPDSFMEYRPTYEEWIRISTRHPGARADRYPEVVDRDRPWPLPECRVNEWTLLVDLQKARETTIPMGGAMPIGASYGMDTGTQWFHDVMNAGHHVAHLDTSPYARHAWASSTGGGFPALSNKTEYDYGEAMAYEHLRVNYPNYFRLLLNHAPALGQ